MVENSIVYADSGERKVKVTREIVGENLIQVGSIFIFKENVQFN
jgi:hypothetical protein